MMNEVVKGLWLGDLPSAMDVTELKANKIFSVLSVMRGRIAIHETFIQHQISIDDTEDADILTHLLPSIHYVQAELNKGRNVLVHCRAGVSRSATIIAAYLMYSRNVGTEEALAIICQVRPFIDPNPSFLRQLEIFHKTDHKVSGRETGIRRFYLARAAEKVIHAGGDGAKSQLDMLATYLQMPSESNPSTLPTPRRYVRCKKCRQELASREHMLDHGQLGPAAVASATPSLSRRSLAVQQQSSGQSDTSVSPPTRRPLEPRSLSSGSGIDPSATSTIDSAGADAEKLGPETTSVGLGRRNWGAERSSNLASGLGGSTDSSSESNEELGTSQKSGARGVRKTGEEPSAMDTVLAQRPRTAHLVSPANLTAQLYANPKLAALRSPSLNLSTGSPSQAPLSTTSPEPKPPVISPPIIVNPKCSGYFVEPMKWMEPFLQEGHLSGKITCPNKKCGAKLGNYDWAGVCCGCKEWVVPGFCINRSKVDEVAT